VQKINRGFSHAVGRGARAGCNLGSLPLACQKLSIYQVNDDFLVDVAFACALCELNSQFTLFGHDTAV